MNETKRINWRGQTLFAGIDLHKSKWVVTVRTSDLHLKTYVSPPDREHLVKSITRLFPGAKIRAVYEAGCFGYHLAYYLCQNGIETIIVSPHTIPVKPGSFVKTDKIDSRKLALELSKGTLESIYRPSVEDLQDRSLLRKRNQILKRRIQVQNQIKSDLLFYGIEIKTTETGYWSLQYVEKLKALEFRNEYYTQAFRFLLEEYEYLRERLGQIHKMLVKLSMTSKYRHNVTLLRTVPGIGILSAMTILLEIVDIHRFKSGEKFVSFIGLTPSEHSSGENSRKGSLTVMGKRVLRSLFIEISWTAIRKDPVLLEKFNRVRKGKSKTKAIVSVANSLAKRIRKVWKDQEPYALGVVN